MRLKKHIIPVVVVLGAILIISVFMIKNMNYCDTLENREQRLREISNLGEITSIDQEISLDDYIISGYTTKNNRHGLAMFVPTGNGKYEFQRNLNKQNYELLFLAVTINQTHYDLFWANKANLDYAEITYTVDGKSSEIITVNVQDNQIIYIEAPAKDYNVNYIVVDKNGTRYE